MASNIAMDCFQWSNIFALNIRQMMISWIFLITFWVCMTFGAQGVCLGWIFGNNKSIQRHKWLHKWRCICMFLRTQCLIGLNGVTTQLFVILH